MMSHVTEIPGRPTVVLVHGAFADGSSWNGVIERLHAKGISVTAPANPLRGLSADSAYLEGVLGQLKGPVVLVGHSYAGAVISNAAKHASNVVGLVFVAAFAPDEGEVLGQVTPSSKDSILMPALVPHEYASGPNAQAVEFVVDPSKFRDAFAGDYLPRRPRSWRLRSDQSPTRRSPIPPRHPPGRTGRRGQWLPPAIGLPALI
jgi:pimeloyl-ACP methyl ester carboxylesterase